MSKRKKRIIWIVVIAVVVFAVAAIVVGICARKKAASRFTGGNMMMQQSTIQLGKQDLSTSISVTGSLASAKTKTVSANMNGTEVEAVYVEIGDIVKKGDKLVAFDLTDLKELLADAKENLADANETLAETKEDADENIADAKEKLADAKANYQAAKKAKAQDLEQKKEAYEQAKDALEQAKDNKEKSVEEAQSKVEEAQERVEEAKENVQAGSITAPISGMVTALNVEAGETYEGGIIVQIDDVSSYTVSASVDEYDVINVAKGQKVIVTTETTGDEELVGEISFVSPTKGSSEGMGISSASSGYSIKITLPVEDDRLRLGLTAACEIIIEEAEDVFAVPYDAVHTNANGEQVIYVVEEGSDVADYTEVVVTVGMETDYYVEITGDSLYEGMSVVIPTDEVEISTSSDEESISIPGMGGFGGNAGGGMPDMGGSNGGGNNGGGRGSNGGGQMTPPGF